MWCTDDVIYWWWHSDCVVKPENGSKTPMRTWASCLNREIFAPKIELSQTLFWCGQEIVFYYICNFMGKTVRKSNQEHYFKVNFSFWILRMLMLIFSHLSQWFFTSDCVTMNFSLKAGNLFSFFRAHNFQRLHYLYLFLVLNCCMLSSVCFKSCCMSPYDGC